MKYALVKDGKVDNMMLCDSEEDFRFLMESMPAGILNGEWILVTTETNTNDSDPGVGWLFDDTNRKFYPPQPFPSWSLDENYNWKPPMPIPKEEPHKVIWDEQNQIWTDCVNCGS